jgi:ABC-2 type transport system ATP-binding protein
MLAVGRIEDIVSRHATQSVEVVCEGVLGNSIPLIKGAAIRVLQRGSRCWMSLPGHQKVEDVLAAIRQAGGRLVSVIPHKGTLEEIFLEQTNQGI